MSRPVKNKSAFLSEGHIKLLKHLAWQVRRVLKFPVELDDLISIGWYSQARYFENLHGRSKDIKREMANGAKKYKPVWYEVKELMGRSQDNGFLLSSSLQYCPPRGSGPILKGRL